MTRDVTDQLERMKHTAQHPTDSWQGGIFRLPGWISDKGESPFRPLIAIWLSVQTGATFTDELMRPEDSDPARALDVLANGVLSSRSGRYLPKRLEVSDRSLAEYLRDRLSGLEIEVAQVERLELVEELLRRFGESTSGAIGMCGALDAPGVTVERMKAYAEAAADFYRSGLCNHLSATDLVRVESPVPDLDLAHFVVSGVGGRLHGLGFFSSGEEFENLMEANVPPDILAQGTFWSLSYGTLMELPLPDADLWEDHGLSVAGPEAYPFLLCTVGEESFSRPDAPTLAFAEGLLRALARTTEDDLDCGRWTKQVSTYDGNTEITLALPGILGTPPLHSPDVSSTVHDR